MIQGVVKWFNNEKGYGFAHHDGIDYFVHYKEINKVGYKTLIEGEKISFTGEKGHKGFVARNVQSISDNP